MQEAGRDRRIHVTQPKHYAIDRAGTVRRTMPKVRGKSAVKAAKRARRKAHAARQAHLVAA